jgi:hypothetical protein
LRPAELSEDGEIVETKAEGGGRATPVGSNSGSTADVQTEGDCPSRFEEAMELGKNRGRSATAAGPSFQRWNRVVATRNTTLTLLRSP